LGTEFAPASKAQHRWLGIIAPLLARGSHTIGCLGIRRLGVLYPRLVADRAEVSQIDLGSGGECQNLSGDPEQEYFADGMVKEIITALSRFHELFVIARNSSFAFKGRAVDVKQVARDLGVRYVLEDSVRRSQVGCGSWRS
jgi:hypothetical protein